MSIIDRIKAESPSFFKKLRTLALSVGGSALAVIAANKAISLGLNETLLEVLNYVIAVCVAIAGTSQLTKK